MVGAFGEVYLVDWGVASLNRVDGTEHPVSRSGTTDPACAGRRLSCRPNRRRACCPRSGSVPTCSAWARCSTSSCGQPAVQRRNGEREILTRARAGMFVDPEQTERGRSAPALCRIVRKAMAMLPEDRHASALELSRRCGPS